MGCGVSHIGPGNHLLTQEMTMTTKKTTAEKPAKTQAAGPKKPTKRANPWTRYLLPSKRRAA